MINISVFWLINPVSLVVSLCFFRRHRRVNISNLSKKKSDEICTLCLAPISKSLHAHMLNWNGENGHVCLISSCQQCHRAIGVTVDLWLVVFRRYEEGFFFVYAVVWVFLKSQRLAGNGTIETFVSRSQLFWRQPLAIIFCVFFSICFFFPVFIQLQRECLWALTFIN